MIIEDISDEFASIFEMYSDITQRNYRDFWLIKQEFSIATKDSEAKLLNKKLKIYM